METVKQFSPKTLDDFRLIDMATKSNDQKAYQLLMSRYKRSVLHIIFKMTKHVEDTEDLTIEVFAKAFKNLHRFNKDFAFSTWLFRIATNHTIDYLRKRRLQTVSLNNSYFNDDGDSYTVEIADSDRNPQEHALNEEKIHAMRKLVSRLPDRYRRLVELRYFDEFSYEEIRKEVNAPLGTVKAQLHRSREIMYQMVEAMDEDTASIKV